MNKPYSTGCTQVCNQGRDCTCVVQQCQSAAPEGGNVWFVGPEPVELNVFQSIALYLLLIVLSLISIGLLAAGGSYFYNHFFN